MKTILTTLIALLLTACASSITLDSQGNITSASGSAGTWAAVRMAEAKIELLKHQANITQIAADAAAAERADKAILETAIKGNDYAKGAAAVHFASRGKSAPIQSVAVQQPKQADPQPREAWQDALQMALPFGQLATQWYGIRQNTAVQREGMYYADRASERNATLIGGIAKQGIDAAGKVTYPPVYTVPQGTTEAVPLTPAAP